MQVRCSGVHLSFQVLRGAESDRDAQIANVGRPDVEARVPGAVGLHAEQVAATFSRRYRPLSASSVISARHSAASRSYPPSGSAACHAS